MLLEQILVAFHPIVLWQSRVSAELPKEFLSQGSPTSIQSKGIGAIG
jgi:hypothetical protein